MLELRQSATDKVIPFLLVVSANHIDGATGLRRAWRFPRTAGRSRRLRGWRRTRILRARWSSICGPECTELGNATISEVLIDREAGKEPSDG